MTSRPLHATLIAIAFSAAPFLVAAGEIKLNTEQIQEALTGNTVHGMWGDSEYYSYFDEDGRTSYTTRTGTEWGIWRAAHDQYCSTWPTSRESCYDILRDDDTIIWVSPFSGNRYESTLIQGETLHTFQ